MAFRASSGTSLAICFSSVVSLSWDFSPPMYVLFPLSSEGAVEFISPLLTGNLISLFLWILFEYWAESEAVSFIALVQRSLATKGPIRSQAHRQVIVNHLWYDAGNKRVALSFHPKFWNFGNGSKWYINFLGKFPGNRKIIQFPKCEPFDKQFQLSWRPNFLEFKWNFRSNGQRSRCFISI